MFDVIVVGGSYAGVSAALQIARARRRVLVLDAGRRRNRFAAHAHGFLGQDGRPPGEIAARAREELLAYPTVTWVERAATGARPEGDGFVVRAGEDELEGRRLVLAAGVVDELPSLPGLAERWGKTVAHCPYCHGYEFGQGPLGVLARTPLSMHQALLVPEWSAPGATTLFLDGAFEPDGLFVMPQTRIACPVPAELGCEVEEGPLGPFLKVDAMKETTVRGVFACGDIAVPAGSVAMAVGDGARAGLAAHRSLIFH